VENVDIYARDIYYRYNQSGNEIIQNNNNFQTTVKKSPMLNKNNLLILVPVVLITGAVIKSYAQTWTSTSALGNDYESVWESANGMIAIASSSIWTPAISTNYGATWNTNTRATSITNIFSTLASSADGKKWVGTFHSAPDYIYVSTNSGQSWAPTASPSSSQWETVASSADGTILAATIFNGTIYYSTNSGSSWLPSGAPSKKWEALSMSADGTKIVAAANNDTIYALTNLGGTWTPTGASIDTWQSLAGSADESRLVASSGSGTFVSSNSGANWTPGTAISGQVTSSSDGSKLAVFNGYQIYTSSDYGNTWVSNNWPNSCIFQSICSSADGNRLFAVGTSLNGVWTCQLNPSAPLNISRTAPTNVVISWLLPSTNFVLQRNLDLTTTLWSNVTNLPVLNLTNLQNQIMLPSPAGRAFYRLKTQ
jgi:hypothetical protein